MERPAQGRRLAAFFVVACAITWACAAPLAWAWWRGDPPTSLALTLAGLSAFGPTLAAVAVTRGARESAAVFGPWATSPIWIVVALLLPMASYVTARAIDAALGHPPADWVQWPRTAEHVAALVVFSLGEEFGWRGFAQPRMVARYGPVAGPLWLGLAWAVWHAMYLVLPTGAIDLAGAAMLLALLPAYSVLYAWLMQRGGGSLAIALALHAGGHLDNVQRMPAEDVRARVLCVLAVWVAAWLAARRLRRDHASRLAA